MRTRVYRWLVATCAVAVATGGFVSVASAQGCQALWVERNSYYKDAGYCFKTARAISYFGNQGCMYDYEGAVPLSPDVRARIAQITWLERTHGCN